MIDQERFPMITTQFDHAAHHSPQRLYIQNIRLTLKDLLPETFFESKWQQEKMPENLRKKMYSVLPIVKASLCEKAGENMSFFCLFRSRFNAFKFFFDLISQWLVPGKRLNVVLVNAVDLRLPILGDDWLTLCEVMIHVENREDLEIIQRNFPVIETEAKLGLGSEYYARKILEVKGVSPDQKTAMIQQHMANLIRRMPEIFSKDVLTEMQLVLALCHDDFKEQRSISHLIRLIGAHYLFRKQLLQYVKEAPHKRHVCLKLFKTSVDYPQQKKQVLAIIVGLNFFREKEVFEQRHLLKAIKTYIPNAEAIDQTFFSNRKRSEQVTTVYIEIEKSDGTSFSSDEISTLKKHLPKDLQNHIGRLMLPVFLPRNEEEIMRNVLSLSNQLKYLRDIPQVFISFDEQTDRNLFFTVIFVRILSQESKSIQEKIRSADSFLRYIHDRTRIVGTLRKKYDKEATIFRVKFPKENFVRGGGDLIDLHMARQAVVNELSRIMGDFRDFNGGMISKQHEFLMEVRKHLEKEKANYSDILLENFFYSLTPVIVRTVLEPFAFTSLFQMLLEMQEKGIPKDHKCSIKMQYDTNFSYVMLLAHHRSALDEPTRIIHRFSHSGAELVQGYAKGSEYVSMGYICRCMDPYKQAQFRSAVESVMDFLNPKSPSDSSSLLVQTAH